VGTPYSKSVPKNWHKKSYAQDKILLSFTLVGEIKKAAIKQPEIETSC
jgi:hypothetical protein